jgi:hypothetical protein
MQRKKLGIWIDSRLAWMATIGENGFHEITIESGAERKPRIPGETSRKKVRASKGFDYESNQMAHFQEMMKKFLRQVVQHIEPPAEVVIFGPGETKRLLAAELAQHKGVAVLAVKAVDKATINQKRKMVREFFQVEGASGKVR